MADDDIDDQLLAKEALQESRVTNILKIVNDGVELMEYLRSEGKYASGDNNPWPGLILLDLNMPRKDGREALAELKTDPKLRRIPVVILTTSKTEEDMLRGYDLGAASYLTKPVTFEGLVDLMQILGRYWVEFVELPGSNNSPD
jgi:two-component system response regulator